MIEHFTHSVNHAVYFNKIVLFTDPPKIESSTADQSAAFGEDVNLRCEASGTPDPVISWYRYDFNGDKKGRKTHIVIRELLGRVTGERVTGESHLRESLVRVTGDV